MDRTMPELPMCDRLCLTVVWPSAGLCPTGRHGPSCRRFCCAASSAARRPARARNT